MPLREGKSKIARWILASVFSTFALYSAALLISWVTISRWSKTETTGQIIVDGPKVYTRERLVNDRLEEASWLASQLKETNGELYGAQFQSIAGQLTALNRDELRVLSSASTNTDTAKGYSTANDNNTTKTRSRPDELTMDRFRDLHTFREEVRAAIMQTQLDDRHDLNGNTVYRLTFDTTIIPGINTHKLAWIDIKLTREKGPNENREIFNDWRKSTEKDATSLLRSRLSAFIGYGLSPDEQLNLFSFFVDEICRQYDRNHCLPSIFNFIDQSIAEKKSFLKELIRNNIEYTRARFLIDSKFDEVFIQYNDFCLRKTLGVDKDRITYIKFSLSSFVDTNNGLPCQPPDSRNAAVPLPYYRLLAIADLYDRITNYGGIRFRTNFNIITIGQLTLRGLILNWLPDIKKHCGSRRANETCSPLIPLLDSETIRCIIAEQTIRDLGNRKDGELLTYFNIVVSGKEMNSCSININEKTKCAPKDRLMSECTPEGAFKQQYTPEAKLAGKLATNVTAFSYAVTPRNMMQRLGITTVNDDVLAAVAELKDKKLLAQAISLLREKSQKLELAQGFPIIVGRGSNQTTSLGAEGDARARFGWLIAPVIRSGSDNFSVESLQATQQYTLAAVVSIPSWWRRARVFYTVCWVDPNYLALISAGSASGCSSIENKWWWGTIDLPGRIDEISRKLGVWVINEPSLAESQEWVLTAGKKQAVVIQGTRLWRSTAVTLASQKADKIEVLPNMNGIIATFNCLQEYSGEDLPKLQVWTSEGSTPPKGVIITPPIAGSSCTDDDKPMLVKSKVDTPSLDDGQQWTLTAGCKQTMVVRGKRLWYGTVVTVGSQKADAIELLPGSNGVIATFDCLHQPEGPAMLQAWTSEGVTSPVRVAVASPKDGQQCAEGNDQARAGLGAP